MMWILGNDDGVADCKDHEEIMNSFGLGRQVHFHVPRLNGQLNVELAEELTQRRIHFQQRQLRRPINLLFP